jgi:mannose-1-phosphate guanylyltransferase/mannose-6-phosphate isomerase
MGQTKHPVDPSAAGRTHPAYAVILAGGSGTRLWPLSRTLLPKQLLAISGEKTLLQNTLTRTLAVFPARETVVVTGEEHVFEVRGQLRKVDTGLEDRILTEPMGRNTLPATLLALDRILSDAASAKPKDVILGVFPADHMVGDVSAWTACMRRGMALAREGYPVIFGTAAVAPETGYGYIRLGEALGEAAFLADGFTEKPDLARAQAMVAGGGHLWNTGMFLVRADVLLDAVRRFVPALHAWWKARREKPLAAGYAGLPDLSLDYGLLERMQRLAVVAAAFEWDDLGNWEAVYRLGKKDENGCVIQGDVLALDCANSLFVSRGGKLAVTGLSDMIMVQTRDATLACPLSKPQGVKDVVAALRAEGSSLVEAHVVVRRPWGSYTVLEEGPGYKIKRIEVLPGARLSLQMHHHRSEHWVAIAGTAEVQLGERTLLLTENQSVDIPKTTSHRLSNPGKVPVEIIEIQSGPYLEEDDIVRFDDVYGRRVGGPTAADAGPEPERGQGR